MQEVPTIFVLMGVTGDLARKKLIPALYSLFAHKLLPKRFAVVGFSRRPWKDRELRDYIRTILAPKASASSLDDFLDHVSYTPGVFDDPNGYVNLKSHLEGIDKGWGQCSNKLLYLAVAPSFYPVIFKECKNSGLNIPCGGDLGWTRVLVEKPFGRDSETALVLERELSDAFKQSQIFRVDHYLAKTAVQNILAFRLKNPLIEKKWNKEAIEKIHIKMYEKIGLEDRGDFYDGVGALRDVGQNHVLEILALTAMEKPEMADTENIRKERATILDHLKTVDSNNAIFRGQYAGFRSEEGVASDSNTETYFKVMAELPTTRWGGVSFILEAGKNLPESKVQVDVFFKSEAGIPHNLVTLLIQPLAKPAAVPDAYERVFYDCMNGDQTFFASAEEVAAEWKFITPLLSAMKKVPLETYEKGTMPV